MRHKSLLIPRNAADGPAWDGRENNSLDARLRVKCCLRGAWETPPEVMAVELQAWTRPRVCEESAGSGRGTAPALDPPDVPKEGSLQFAVPWLPTLSRSIPGAAMDPPGRSISGVLCCPLSPKRRGPVGSRKNLVGLEATQKGWGEGRVNTIGFGI